MSFRGGALLGWVSASAPLATLTVTDDRLTLHVRLLGRVELAPEDVVAVRSVDRLFRTGVAIDHMRDDQPAKLLFLHRDPATVLAAIERAAFVPAADASETPERPFPFRLVPLLSLLALFFGALAFDQPWRLFTGGVRHVGGPGAVVAMGSVLAVAMGLHGSPRMRRWLLTRPFGVVRPVVRLLLATAGPLFIVFGLLWILGVRIPPH